MVKYPEAIKQDKNSWLWKPIYKRVKEKNQQFACTFCGKPGSGKSYTALSIAELFYPDIDVNESIFFTPKDFAKKVNEKLPKGYPLILDDAGLSILSTEAMQKEIRNISKTLQSIRHRNLLVFLTVPSFGLLAKSTRILSDYYCNPLRIDYDTEETICKFQRIKFDALSGDMYRSNPVRSYYKKNELSGFTELVQEKYLCFRIKKPSEKVCKDYDKFKKERMKEFDEQNYFELENRHQQKTKRTLTNKQMVARIRQKKDYFIQNNKVSWEKIMLEFEIGQNKARAIANMV